MHHSCTLTECLDPTQLLLPLPLQGQRRKPGICQSSVRLSRQMLPLAFTDFSLPPPIFNPSNREPWYCRSHLNISLASYEDQSYYTLFVCHWACSMQASFYHAWRYLFYVSETLNKGYLYPCGCRARKEKKKKPWETLSFQHSVCSSTKLLWLIFLG